DSATSRHPLEDLQKLAKEWDVPVLSDEFARLMDINDPLAGFREKFHYPKMGDLPLVRRVDGQPPVDPSEDGIYLCGNSLGLMPREVRNQLDTQMSQWARFGVFGHRHGFMPWAFCDEWLLQDMSDLVGALPEETCVMNSLTVNLHLCLTAFYQPAGARTKVLLESQAFPSDHYAVESQIRQRGLDPAAEMICLKPRDGEHCLRTEDILQTIQSRGQEIALVFFSGVHYYTGQLFDIAAITEVSRASGCLVGWDLAHAVGNVPLRLHDWDVDFAAWCTYKYLNCGAGCIAGAFVHRRHLGGGSRERLPRLEGWWGHRIETRFDMTNQMEPDETAGQFRVTNPSMIQAACVRASLDVFKLAGMQQIRRKSLLLTAYLEHLLKHRVPSCSVISPRDPQARGAQLSLLLACPVERVLSELEARGVACDERKPNVIRVAPAPLYNSFGDVLRFVKVLADVMPTDLN
ncbi:hypothetical protein BOX15_Mlig003145g1, partial [Macrostomum lignano]